MKKLLLLGSVVAPCPPKKQGGTERVAYVQAKELAKRGKQLLFVGAVGTQGNFSDQLALDNEEKDSILGNIEFIEIGGGTQFGNASDAMKIDPSTVEASRNLRVEMANLAKVQQLMIERRDEYSVILNNMRGEAVFLPLAKMLNKSLLNVMHLNIFPQLADTFSTYKTRVITISDAQRIGFENLTYAQTIPNPVNINTFTFNPLPKEYALMLSTVGYHKNQKDAILACQNAQIPLVLAGKIRDKEYFEQEIKPYIDDKLVIYHGELAFAEKLKLYQEAKVFLFPILWQEPFGLVLIESLACGTPVIAYPHGGPKEIIEDGVTGFLVDNAEQMAEKITKIDTIRREDCRKAAEERFSEESIGQKYYDVLVKNL